jgi:hypothetical protein
MWLLRLKDGLELTEKELGCWDNVPGDVEIAAAALVINRQGAKPYVIDYHGYEQYCIARVGSAPQGAVATFVGYSVSVIKQGVVLEHEIYGDGMKLRMYPRERCDVPDHCFRRGTA